MKRVKFFYKPQMQAETDLAELEDRINVYINSLPGITLGGRPQGFLDVQFQYDPNNNSSYADVIVMVTSEDDEQPTS